MSDHVSSDDHKAIFNHGRFRWLGMVARDAALSSTAVRVAVIIWDRFNVSRGGAWPSINRIADEIGMHRSTVLRAIRDLEDRGWICTTHGGRGRSNFYQPTFRSEEVDQVDES